MNTQHFPSFIRTHYPILRGETNELLIELGDEFKSYLQEKFKDNMDKIELAWDISPQKVVMNAMTDAFSMKGYSPVLIIHFGEFMEKMRKEALEEENKTK